MQRATAQKDVKRVVKSRGYAAGVRVHPGGNKVKDDATYYFQLPTKIWVLLVSKKCIKFLHNNKKMHEMKKERKMEKKVKRRIVCI